MTVVTMLLMFVAALSSVTISAERRYEPLPAYCEGSMMPYDFDAVEPCAWPDTLRPVYCAYVARHGARYMTGSGKFKALEKVLIQARRQGTITADGIAFLGMIDSIRTLSHDRWGELSGVGIDEERRLGSEILDAYPALRTPGASVGTLSSFVPRAIMTMYEFNHSLALGNDSLETVAESGPAFSPLVYCFAYDKSYAEWRKNGAWQEVVAEMERDSIGLEPLQRLTGNAEGIDAERGRKLVMEIYSVLQSRRAMGLSAPDTRWMSRDEYRRCWQVSNLTHYLRNSVSGMESRTLSRATAPLIHAIINGADSAASAPERRPRLDGYFGHAETLLPLLSVMRIPGCYALPLDYNRLSQSWQLQRITPLGANLAVFLLEGPSDRIYAAVRLNGRNVAPLQGKPSIVPWSELRDYWLYILSSLTMY